MPSKNQRKKYLFRDKGLNREQVKETRDIVYKTVKRKADRKFKASDFILFTGTGGSVVRLTGIAQGIDDDQRIGRSVEITKLHVNYTMEVADTPFNVMRLIIFEWKDESTPNDVQVLNTTLQTTLPWLATYNNRTAKQYNILYDRIVSLYADKPIVTGKFTKYYRKGLTVDYGGTGATSLAVKNDIYVMLLTDSLAIPNPGIDVAYQIDYTDI